VNRLRALSVVAIASLFVGASVAQTAKAADSATDEPATQDRALAEALFRDGKTLADDGRIEEACAKFKESQRLDPALGTLLYLATCYEQSGKTASAWAAFQSAQELAHNRKDKAREAIARERAAAIEPNLSKLKLSITIPVAGTQIRVDGRLLGPAALSTPLPFDPGTHTIEATAPEKRAWSQSVELQPGPSTLAVRIPPFEPDIPEPAPVAAETAKPAAVAPHPPRDTSATNWPRLAGFVSLGVGGVGLAAGTYFGLHAYSVAKGAEHHCSGSICDQTGLNAYASARTAANISNVGFALGIVGIGAGTYLLISSAGESKTTQSAFWVGGAPGHVVAGGSF
jgi:hypothetical protein